MDDKFGLPGNGIRIPFDQQTLDLSILICLVMVHIIKHLLGSHLRRILLNKHVFVLCHFARRSIAQLVTCYVFLVAAWSRVRPPANPQFLVYIFLFLINI